MSLKFHYFIISTIIVSLIRAKNIPIDFMYQNNENINSNNNVKEDKNSWKLVNNDMDNNWNLKENDVIYNWKPGYNIGVDVHVKKSCPSHISNQGYKCCVNECTYLYTDSNGSWSIEDGEWCWCSMNNYGNMYGHVDENTIWNDNSQTKFETKKKNNHRNHSNKIKNKKMKNKKNNHWKGSINNIFSNWKNNDGYGVSNTIHEKCPSSSEGYKCCEENCVSVYSDSNGNWGYENGEWCWCKNENDNRSSVFHQ